MTRRRTVLVVMCVAFCARPTAAEPAEAKPTGAASSDTPVVFPRLTLIELQYPQGVAVSIGAWARPWRGDGLRPGFVADVEAGLSGASLNLGLGGSTPLNGDVERARTFGVQGVLLRTWPWWSPWLPTSRTYGGVEVFGHAFAFRCSLGLLWAVDRSIAPTRTVTGGCGLGWP